MHEFKFEIGHLREVENEWPKCIWQLLLIQDIRYLWYEPVCYAVNLFTFNVAGCLASFTFLFSPEKLGCSSSNRETAVSSKQFEVEPF